MAVNCVQVCISHSRCGVSFLQVDGNDLREATHEEAVEVIRKANSPVRFLVQSLVNPPQVYRINWILVSVCFASISDTAFAT